MGPVEDLDQVLLLLLGFFVLLSVLLVVMAWIEPDSDHPVASGLRRLLGFWRDRR
jgi:hypothetical protein